MTTEELWKIAEEEHGTDGLWLGITSSGNVQVRKHGVLVAVLTEQDLYARTTDAMDAMTENLNPVPPRNQ